MRNWVRYAGLTATILSLLLIITARRVASAAWLLPVAEVLAVIGVVLLIVNIVRQFRNPDRR